MDELSVADLNWHQEDFLGIILFVGLSGTLKKPGKVAAKSNKPGTLHRMRTVPFDTHSKKRQTDMSTIRLQQKSTQR